MRYIQTNSSTALKNDRVIDRPKQEHRNQGLRWSSRVSSQSMCSSISLDTQPNVAGDLRVKGDFSPFFFLREFLVVDQIDQPSVVLLPHHRQR